MRPLDEMLEKCIYESSVMEYHRNVMMPFIYFGSENRIIANYTTQKLLRMFMMGK